jgi:hypothetical protein
MALPTISTPKYEMEIPSTGQKVSYRPFLVKEEKILMIASESKDVKEMSKAMKNVVGSCLETEIDVDSLTVFDLEYIFLNLRSRSVGETVEVSIKCSHCDKSTPVTVDLSDVEVTKQKKSDLKIAIQDDIGVVMRYPTVDDGFDYDNKDPMKSIIRCIDYIYDSKQVYKASESTPAELNEFIESLSHEHLAKIFKFFEEMPKVKKKIDFKCLHCGEDDSYTAVGMTDFFT